MSFMNFIDGHKPAEDRGNVHWFRAGSDGAPFRGNGVPLLREEEFEEHTETVYDCKFGVFNTATPKQQQHGRTYQEILDGVMSNWFRLTGPREYKWGPTGDGGEPAMFVYVEWAEPYREIQKSKLASITGRHTR